MGWAEVIYSQDGTITMYERGEECYSEDEPTTNKRTFDGESWEDEYYERESFDASGMLKQSTDLSMPDNPLFSDFVDQAILLVAVWDTFIQRPEVNFTTLQTGIHSFELGSMGTIAPSTDVGFELHRMGKSLQTHHVPTEWKMPTFIDGEFNNFTFFGDPKELFPQAILGFDEAAREAWLLFRWGCSRTGE